MNKFFDDYDDFDFEFEDAMSRRRARPESRSRRRKAAGKRRPDAPKYPSHWDDEAWDDEDDLAFESLDFDDYQDDSLNRWH